MASWRRPVMRRGPLGGSPLPDLKAEFNPTPHLRGTVSMARAASVDSANSQFFICFQPRFALDNNYTAFGRVFAGMQYVEAIQRGEPPATRDRYLQASSADTCLAGFRVAKPAAPVDTPVTLSDKQTLN
jgi:cyclophilin family peptidyl-prolyl cis-trans isomerase